MKVSLKSVVIFALLIGSIFTTYTVQQVNASPTLVTISTTNTEGVITLSINNNEASTSSVSSFILQINNGGTFKSFNLENGWFGVKTSPTTLAFSAINPLKPGNSISLQIKTDQQKPVMTWRASDVNNIEIGSGVIDTQTLGSPPTSGGNSPPTSGGNSPPTLRGILDSSTFRIIPSTPAIGSHIRVIGYSFSSLTNLDLYIGNEKIGSFSSNDKGNIVTTIVIPNSEQVGSVNFILKDQQGNQKSFSTNLKAVQKVGTALTIPLTINFDPISHRGETKLVSGTATPGTTLTFTIADSKGNSITTLTAHPNKDGNYSFKRTIPTDSTFGKYSVIVSDGKNQVSKQFSVVTIHNITVATSSERYEPGQTVIVNGTSISNQITTFVFSDPTGHQIYSKDANVTSSGTVSTSYRLEDSAMKGTYTLDATQGNDTSLLYFGVGQDPSLPITAKLDKLSYSVTDKPVISITGPSSSTLNLVIVDPSDTQKFADVINLGPDGQATYSFNLTAYTSGIYSAVVTHADQKIQNQFAVGLGIGPGKIILNTVKNAYLSGDNIIIIGTSNPNTLLQISLTDPNGIQVKTVQTFSDKTGHFSSFDFKIPSIAIPGIWKIDAGTGINHASINIIVKSTKQGITIHLDRPSGIYTKGEILALSGTDAGNTASVSIKISNNSTIVDTLPTTSTNRGDYNTSWQVPRNINPGIYTVEASSITGKATISLRVQ
jgi:hypothetical protein